MLRRSGSRWRIPAPMRGGLADITCMAYTHSADPNDQDRSCGEDQFSNTRIHIHAPSSTLAQNNQHGKFKRRSRYLPKQISPQQPHAITERHDHSSRHVRGTFDKQPFMLSGSYPRSRIDTSARPLTCCVAMEFEMPRATWRGFLRLSLVSCPIYLSPATTRMKP